MQQVIWGLEKPLLQVYPETEKDESLKEVVTEEPPGGEVSEGDADAVHAEWF